MGYDRMRKHRRPSRRPVLFKGVDPVAKKKLNSDKEAGLTAEIRAEADRILREKAEKKQRSKKRLRIILLVVIPVIVLAAGFFVLKKTVLSSWFAYLHAEHLMKDGQYEAAEQEFRDLLQYKDSLERRKDAQIAQAMEYWDAGDLDTAHHILIQVYQRADADELRAQLELQMGDQALTGGDYVSALHWYEEAGSYGDAPKKLADTRLAAYDRAAALADAGDAFQAMEIFVSIHDVKDSADRMRQLAQRAGQVLSGGLHTVFALRNDGYTYCTGELVALQNEFTQWPEVVSVAGGSGHVAAALADGTVRAAGRNLYGQCDVEGWTDIVAVAASYEHTVGLRADGTVVAAGDNTYGQCDVDGWTDIVAIAAGYMHTVGLRADGTVVAAGCSDDGQCDVDGWTDVTMLAANYYTTVAVRADGSVVWAGDNSFGQCDFDSRSDAVAASVAEKNVVLLLEDGTAKSYGSTDNDQQLLSLFDHVVAVYASDTRCTCLLTNDGTLIIAGEETPVRANQEWHDYGILR